MQGPQTLCGAYAKGVAYCACAHKFCKPKSTFCGGFNGSKFDGCRKACCSSPEVAPICEDLPHESPLYANPCGPACLVQGRRVRVQLKPKDDTKLSGPLRYIVDSGSAFHIANKRELSSELHGFAISILLSKWRQSMGL